MSIETSVTKGEVARTYYLFDENVFDLAVYGIDTTASPSTVVERVFMNAGLDVYEVNAYGEYYIKLISTKCVYRRVCKVVEELKQAVDYDKASAIYEEWQSKLEHLRSHNGILYVEKLNKQSYEVYHQINRVYSYLLERLGRDKDIAAIEAQITT